MEKEKRVSTAEKEAHRLAIDNFMREKSGFSLIHKYDLRTH